MLVDMRIACIFLLFSGILTASAQAPQGAPSTDIEKLVRDGISAQQRGDFNTAIEEYRKALDADPGRVDVRANLGASLADSGQLDAAIAEDERALAAAPHNAGLRKNLGLAYYKKGDMAHAHDQFEKVRAARPSDVATAVLLGYTDIKLNKGADAAAMLAPLEAGRESDFDFEYVLGYAYILSGKDTEGLPRMEKVAQATQSAEAYVIAGNVRLHRREFHEARKDLDAAMALTPTFPGLATMAGQARDALGDTEAAQPCFESALRQDPRDFVANLYLGSMLVKQRDFERARPLLEMALRLLPTAPLARLQMAKLNGMTGRYAEAAATLEDLEKSDPNWLDPHVELAPIYYKLHRPEDGQREREIVEKIEASQQKAGPPKQ
jgi:tetratricopeptide (TPR) repeat protein